MLTGHLTNAQHNDIVVSCFLIPDSSTGYLPPGVHDASWCEVATRFSSNSHRTRLVGGLLAALQSLASAGCRSVLIDGSFVSRIDLPGDYDGAWDARGVDPNRLDPVLLDFSNGRAAMKSKYLGELFPATFCRPGCALPRLLSEGPQRGAQGRRQPRT
jgi:hypothetical protein